MEAKLVSIASVLLTLPLQVSELPKRGTSVTAQAGQNGVGEAYEVMLAASRQGVKVINSSCLGTGPNSIIARQMLQKAGITTTTAKVVGDIGMKMMLVEECGYYTSIHTGGVETDLSAEELGHLAVNTGDIVYLSAGDLVHAAYREALSQWLPTLSEGVQVVMATTPLISQVKPKWLEPFWAFVDILSASAAELSFLPEIAADPQGFLRANMAEDALLIKRVGSEGTLVYQQDRVYRIPSTEITIIDTLGVGASHTGVMIANLLKGATVAESVWKANLAGALTASSYGINACPTWKEIEAYAEEQADTFQIIECGE